MSFKPGEKFSGKYVEVVLAGSGFDIRIKPSFRREGVFIYFQEACDQKRGPEMDPYSLREVNKKGKVIDNYIARKLKEFETGCKISPHPRFRKGPSRETFTQKLQRMFDNLKNL